VLARRLDGLLPLRLTVFRQRRARLLRNDAGGRALSFWCFDLLSLEDKGLCELPLRLRLRLRRAELRKLLPVGNLHFSAAFAYP
jgi:hypothetical protein